MNEFDKYLYETNLYEQTKSSRSEVTNKTKKKPSNSSNKNKFQESRKVILRQSESRLKNIQINVKPCLPLNIDCTGLQKQIEQFQQIRKQNCTQILKYLIFGYLQLLQQIQKNKILKQQPTIHPKTVKILHQSTPQQQLQKLKNKAIEIEYNILIYHNTAGANYKQSKRYKFQILNLISNLKDTYNENLRESIINQTYSPLAVALMDQIDMLESRKREFIYTRKEVLLDDEERKWEKNCRQSRYESLIKKNRSKFKPGGQNSKEIQKSSLQYYLSKSFIQQMEMELMEIPFKSIRKATLSSLKNTFYK